MPLLLASCFLSLALAPVQGWTAERLPGKPGPFERPLVEVRDLGPYTPVGEDGRWLLLTLKESASSVDLNGDGDTLDQVYAVHDMLAGTTTNLGLALGPFDQPVLGGGKALVSVRESDQGADLNADGDTLDFVCFAVDLASASSTSSGLANAQFPTRLLVDHWAVFTVPESAQGQADLDASGTISGEVLFAWDLGAAAAPVSLQLAVEFPLLGHETFVLAGGEERRYPASDARSDLNGDGDSLDWVLVVYDLRTLTPVDTRLLFSEDIQAVGAHSAIPVTEASQQADLNGDGDTTDTVIFTFDTHTGIMTNLGLASGPALHNFGHGLFRNAAVLRMNEEALAFPVSEAEQGHTDLNGDGDAVDSVLFVRDYATATTIDLGVSTYEYTLGGRLVCLQVSEDGEGVDLDGDGDLLDHVAAVRDLDAGSSWNLGLACEPSTTKAPFAIHGSSFAFQSAEQGVHDWNGDGDGSDSVLFQADASAQAITNLGMAVSSQDFLFAPDGTLAFLVQEGFQGTDLDGDGLFNSLVVQLRTTAGRVANTHQSSVSLLYPGIAHHHPIRGLTHTFVARTRF